MNGVSQEILDEIERRVADAKAEGYAEGVAATKSVFGALAPSTLAAAVFADGMEATASRLSKIDPAFAAVLKDTAAGLKAAVSPPQVASVSVVSDAAVAIKFTANLDVATVALVNFSVTDASGTPVAGSLAYDDSPRTVTFTADAPLAAGTYTLLVGANVRSVAGVKLGTDYTTTVTVA